MARMAWKLSINRERPPNMTTINSSISGPTQTFNCRKAKKNKLFISNAAVLICISLLPFASASLGPLFTSHVSTRKSARGKRFAECKSDELADEWHIFVVPRGGNADYVGDDETWDDAQSEPQPQTDQQMPPRQSQSAQNPYGSGPPWQQNTRPSYPPNQQTFDPRNSQMDPSQSRNEPQLPGSSGRPIYRGHPQQQSHPQQPRDRYMGQQSTHPQQQQHPQSQGMYPPPPQFPVYGDQGGSRGNQIPPSHPSMRVQSAHITNREMGPPGYEEEEEDDWLPFGDNTEESGGIKLPTDRQQGSGDAGGMDLSQFDKDLIFSGLKRLYRKKIRPLELSSKYGHFHSPPLSPSDFDAKPMVLLVGQYSVGKTSFIRYLLGRDFPGQRIGPEPTTDRFTAIIKGESGDKIIPGAALCSQADRPFRGLSPFGNNFLSRFEGVEMDSPILSNITLVDTPGILSGQKQMIGRNYDYEQVMKWFAERSDLIIIMFDAHKLDISDELKQDPWSSWR